MKSMKREKVNLKSSKRRLPSKGASWGVILACIGTMIATVAQGIKLDKEEAAKKAADETNQDNQ